MTTTTHTTILDDERATVVRIARTWDRYRTYREISRHSRVYVWADESFNLAEDLANRTRRPHAAWRAALKPILAELGIDTKGIRWSQTAGCTCPCSPGFVLATTVHADHRAVDFSVTLRGVPTVDETKAPRLVTV